MKGTITDVKADKGFGFVKDADSGVDYFFHKTSMADRSHPFESLRVGDRLEFDECAESSRGPRAENVRLVGI